jgi:hypothetical protein
MDITIDNIDYVYVVYIIYDILNPTKIFLSVLCTIIFTKEWFHPMPPSLLINRSPG